jgi:hypothetical protein
MKKPKSLNRVPDNSVRSETVTKKIEVHELYELIRQLPQTDMGYASFTDLLEKAAGFYACSPLTVRNFIYRNLDKFEVNRGEIRLKLIETVAEEKEDLKEFEEWLANRTAVLEECLEFLKVQNMTPYLENLLVLVSNTREALKSYSDTDLVFLVFSLKNEYGFTPKTEFKEGGLIG